DNNKPLHNAILKQDIKTIKSLLSAGANVFSVDRPSLTPLQFAIEKNKSVAVEYLLKEGAVISVESIPTKLSTALFNVFYRHAIKNNLEDILTKIGSPKQSDNESVPENEAQSRIDEPKRKKTKKTLDVMLCSAVNKGDAAEVKRLLEQGASCNCKDE
ncbi:uncharacterized protein LOC102802216, partial [Saccoglossus kowalevskii]|uniref:Ankyrin repeat domain-containing protein 20B-like n=1 Tax=Saccoglossus kowalevskii TaxID=10224 RepID=A0ABM0MXD4_SACKO